MSSKVGEACENEGIEGSSKNPFDLTKIWRERYFCIGNPSPFISNIDTFLKHSFVFKSFRNEYEIETAFSEMGRKYLLAKRNGVPGPTQSKEFFKGQADIPFHEVPGFTPSFSIHKKSCLDQNEMRECFYLFKLFQNNRLNNVDLTKFNKYREKIAPEQLQYQELAKTSWLRENYKRQIVIKEEVNEAVTSMFKERLKRLEHYPELYTHVEFHSLMHPTVKSVELCFDKQLQQIGEPVRMFLPKLGYYKANIHDIVEELKTVNRILSSREISNVDFSPEISRDKYAEQLATENKALIIISESGFLNLIDNQYPSFEKTWDLPITIKEVVNSKGGKQKLIFVDKALPLRSMNNAIKNKWYCKHSCDILLRRRCTEMKNWLKNSKNPHKAQNECENLGLLNTSKQLNTIEEKILTKNLEEDVEKPVHDKYENSSFEDDSDEDHLLIDMESEEENNSKPNSTLPFQKKTKIELSKTCDSEPNKVNNESLKNCEDINLISNQIKSTTYTLWTLRKTDQNILSKTSLKDLKLLIRCKDGYVFSKDKGGKLLLSVKTEYQTEFGAEALTLSELVRLWGSLLIRPGTNNLEVRVNPLDGNLIMLRKQTIQEVVQKCLRLYKYKPSSSLSTLYSVLEQISNHPPGRYHLYHQPRNEAFVPFYRESNGSYIFNLHSSYKMAEEAQHRAPWNPIDLEILTPVFKYSYRVPGTFVTNRIWQKKGVTKCEIKKEIIRKMKRRPKKKKEKQSK